MHIPFSPFVLAAISLSLGKLVVATGGREKHHGDLISTARHDHDQTIKAMRKERRSLFGGAPILDDVESLLGMGSTTTIPNTFPANGDENMEGNNVFNNAVSTVNQDASTTDPAVSFVTSTTAAAIAVTSNPTSSQPAPIIIVTSSSPTTITTITTTTTTTTTATTTTSSSVSTARTRATTSTTTGTASTTNSTLKPTGTLKSTSTSTSSTSSSSSVSPTSTASGDNSGQKSGIAHMTLIIIIVVASCLGGIGAIWTIIRKFKLSPSRRFENRLAPVDFNSGMGDNSGLGCGMGGGDKHSMEGSDWGTPGVLTSTGIQKELGLNDRDQTTIGAFGQPRGAYATSLSRSDSGGEKGSVYNNNDQGRVNEAISYYGHAPSFPPHLSHPYGAPPPLPYSQIPPAFPPQIYESDSQMGSQYGFPSGYSELNRSNSNAAYLATSHGHGMGATGLHRGPSSAASAYGSNFSRQGSYRR